MVCAIVLMHHEDLMSSKAGNPTKNFWRTKTPILEPGIKSTGAQICHQHACV